MPTAARRFDGAKAFNQPLAWDTSKVKAMFNVAFTFNQPLVWDTSEVTDMSYLFNGVSTFDQALKWDTNKVTEFKQFRRCEKLIPKNDKCVD